MLLRALLGVVQREESWDVETYVAVFHVGDAQEICDKGLDLGGREGFVKSVFDDNHRGLGEGPAHALCLHGVKSAAQK